MKKMWPLRPAKENYKEREDEIRRDERVGKMWEHVKLPIAKK